MFERLATAASHIESKAKFSYDSHLGYITTCPTNIGNINLIFIIFNLILYRDWIEGLYSRKITSFKWIQIERKVPKNCR